MRRESRAAYHVMTHDPPALLDAARTLEVSDYEGDGKLTVRTVSEFAARSEWERAEGGERTVAFHGCTTVRVSYWTSRASGLKT